MTNIAMGNGTFIEVYLLKMGGSFHGYVSHNQMVPSGKLRVGA